MIKKIYLALVHGADSRAERFPLISSCEPIICILLAYGVVSYVLYKWMSKREPFNLRHILIGYDVTVATLSGCVVAQIILSVIRQNPSWICRAMPNKGTFDEESMQVANFSYLALISKIVELMDTVFYTLRKKNKQLLAVHYYHHIMNVVGSFAIARYQPGAPVSVILHFFNSLTHSLLYLNHAALLVGFTFVHRSDWKYFLLTLARVQYTSFIIPSAVAFYIGCTENYTINYLLSGGMVSLMIFHMFYILRDLTASKIYSLKDWSLNTMLPDD